MKLIPSIASVASQMKILRSQRLFLVIDELAYQASGAGQHLEPIFRHRDTSRFVDFQANPRIEDVQRGISQFRQFNPELTIAVGGGTAIDLAKLIGTMAVQEDRPQAIATGRGKIVRPGCPLIAIPTTAGTGSEATHFAVVYVDGKKYSVAHPSMLPHHVVLDPCLTMSMPPSITVATGLDALCQAIESIWSVAASPESIRYATEAIELTFRQLENATHAPTIESRSAMCRGAHLAGKAINLTKTTGPHATSYGLTSQFGVAHGIAVALTLVPFFRHNVEVTDEDCNDPRGADAVLDRMHIIMNALGTRTAVEACQRLRALFDRVGCPQDLNAVGVRTSDQLDMLADSINLERLSNNPRCVSRQQLLEILQSN